MSDTIFQSSDDVRSGAALAHAQQVRFDRPLKLKLGGELPGVTVVYETYGTLNANKDNAVLICHALSGDSHVARHDESDLPGWWDIVVGPGKPIDTNRYFVICPNILGGCRGTTGPNHLNPATGKRYASDFPQITIEDTVDVQRMLIEHLGIERLLAVVGGSMGGHQAMTWATRYPSEVAGCIAIATSPRLTSQAIAFDVVGRNAIMHDPHYHHGHYYDRPHRPDVGLALARMLAHITYLSREAMTAKFDPSRLRPRDVATDFEKKFSVGAYLAYQGNKFVERFDANSYVLLSMMLDLFDMGDTPEVLRRSVCRSTCRWLVMSFTSDWLFPPYQSREIVDALLSCGRRVSYCNVPSPSGHDAFLLSDSIETYGGLIEAFLADLARPSRRPMYERPTRGDQIDLRIIRDLIPRGASVLDLGCGDGELLAELAWRGHERLLGIEVNPAAILACVRRGVDVIHADLNERLGFLRDGQFDVVVLSQAMQSIADTVGILQEMTRVGKRAIINFPNFAFRELREMYYRQGRSPKAQGAYSYEWYNTPNRRFPSIVDVEELCQSLGIRIERKVCLNTATDEEVTDDPNLNADAAIFVLSRNA
jgi:homoserine O-acetyltransferase